MEKSLIIGFVAVLLVVYGICLLFGVGTNLIAGISSMSKIEKNKMDLKKFGKATGVMIIMIGILMILFELCKYANLGNMFVWNITEIGTVLVVVIAFSLWQKNNNWCIRKE